MLSRERRLFFLRWLKNPLAIGSAVPSSRGLAKAMAAQLSAIAPAEYVVELGAGTGPVTEALFNSGLSSKQLVVVERDPRFLDMLRQKFPEAVIIQGDACNLRELLHARGIQQIAAVVSSLPLLSMPHNVRHVIVEEAFKALKPDGVLVQFTYGLLSPVPRLNQRAIGIRGRVAKRVWRNFPPARVWRYTADA